MRTMILTTIAGALMVTAASADNEGKGVVNGR